jgi:hypothetical protein
MPRPAPHYHFPYVKFHGRYYPLIPVTLTKGRYAVNTFALLDSGASMSMFRPEIARALRLPLRGKESVSLGTAGGGLNIAVAKVGVEVEDTKFQADIGFSSTYATSFNIIGREGFFRHFSIVFNELMKTVILMPIRGRS